jgi:hypothetical protein
MTNIIKINFKQKSKIIENTNKEGELIQKAEKLFLKRLKDLNKNNPNITYFKGETLRTIAVTEECTNIKTLVKFFPKSQWTINLTSNNIGRHVNGDTLQDSINYPLFEDDILYLYV